MTTSISAGPAIVNMLFGAQPGMCAGHMWLLAHSRSMSAVDVSKRFFTGCRFTNILDRSLVVGFFASTAGGAMFGVGGIGQRLAVPRRCLTLDQIDDHVRVLRAEGISVPVVIVDSNALTLGDDPQQTIRDLRVWAQREAIVVVVIDQLALDGALLIKEFGPDWVTEIGSCGYYGLHRMISMEFDGIFIIDKGEDKDLTKVYLEKHRYELTFSPSRLVVY